MICFKSNGHSTGWILTGLVPIRISVLITSWITPILTLRHWIVQEMMEDQVMISICMVMKGMWNGYEAILWHPFPINLFYGSISWIIVLTRPTSLLHAIPCHPFSSPATDPILITDRFSKHAWSQVSLNVCPDDLSDKPWASCRSVTFFFATRVVREKSSVGSECAQLTNHSVGRPMYYIDEASGGVLRERDSQVMRFHSSHSSRNLWSRWKWIEWNPVCLKRWGRWRLFDWVFSGSWASRRFVREKGNKGMGIRRTCFRVWWLIREQQHRMMRKGENDNLRIGWNGSRKSSKHRIWFHQMIIEGYLHQSNNKSILSRITDPIFSKLCSSPLNSVNEGRSIHSSTHSISLRIVNVFL